MTNTDHDFAMLGGILLGAAFLALLVGPFAGSNTAQALDDDDASQTPDPDRDQDCLRAMVDLGGQGPWDNDDSHADDFDTATEVIAWGSPSQNYTVPKDITYDGHTYSVTRTLPSAEGSDRCLLSWTEGSTSREMWPEWDDIVEKHSVMYVGGEWKAKLDDGGGLAGWTGS